MQDFILPEFIINDFKTSFWGKLIRFTPLHIHSVLVDKIAEKKVDMPVKIASYRLIKDFQPEKAYPFKIGLYQDKKGVRVVAKIWNGKFKNIHYGNMVNEIVATQTLYGLGLRLREKMPSKIKMINTPRLIKVIKKRKSLIFIEEYVTGKNFIDLPEEEKVVVYQKVKEYFKFLADNLSEDEKELIRKVRAKEMLQRYPLILLAALVRRPYLAKELFLGLSIMLKGINILLKSKDYSIVHGDINYDNILISDDAISIIDVEQLMYTVSEMEDVTSLSTARNSDSFTSWIINRNLEKCVSDKNFAHLLSILLIYTETYNLTGSSSPASLSNHIRRLKMALSIYKSTHTVSVSLQKDKSYLFNLINTL